MQTVQYNFNIATRIKCYNAKSLVEKRHLIVVV